MKQRPRSQRTRRTRLPAAERREQILDAAAAEILENGFDDLTMEAITERAGVSKALGYSYFNRFEDLLHALHEREFSVVYERLRPVMLADEDIEDRIRRKVEVYFEVIDERHDLYLSLDANLTGPTYRRERRSRHLAWEAFVAEVIQQEFVAPEDQSRVVARLLMAIDDRCVRLWTRDGLPRREVEDLCVRFQLAGLEELFERRSSSSKTSARPPRTESSRSGGNRGSSRR